MRQSNDTKIKLIDMIMDSQDILKLLYYTDNSINPLEQPNLTSSQKREVRKQIYKNKRIPVADSNIMKTYISTEWGNKNPSRNNKYYIDREFRFYIVSTTSLDENMFIPSRIDEIEDIICEMFHEKIILDGNTIAKAYPTTPLNLPNDFIGRGIIINLIDKNDYMIDARSGNR